MPASSARRGPAPLDVCILWHMHQPLYDDPATGGPAMPWVRLHALKDYADMVALVRGRPGFSVTFNLVPVLIEQLDAAADPARPDPWLEAARRKPGELDDAAKAFLLDSFFSVDPRRTFVALPRFGELKKKAQASDSPTGSDWSDADWRDLQTLFHLAWCGTTLREEPAIRRLIMKGRRYTEEEKQALLDRQQAFLATVLPAYAAARDEGAVELTTTPYYHPILPLLCDLGSVREAAPNAPLPASPPRAAFEDAREQVTSGLDAFAARFGARPAGMWPAEGSLSDEALTLFDAAGVSWVATDEALLTASERAAGRGAAGAQPVSAAPPLAPRRFAGRRTAVFFRDRTLSDLIGFTYSSWRAANAAADLIGRLEAIARKAREGADADPAPVVSIILDGENAWETYPANGTDFLDALYDGLHASPLLRATTFSKHLAGRKTFPELPRLSAGSWIGGSFLTWIGHPEKNRAWELLCAARTAFEESGRPEPARRWLRAAQGSDWFWWFGDDHSSANDATFDRLFRSYLTRVYEACDRPAPPALAAAIKRHSARRRVQDPTAPLRPTVDGKITDYFEWLGSGLALAEPVSSVMAGGAGSVAALAFGANENDLVLRVDPANPPFAATVPAAALEVAVAAPGTTRLRLALVSPPARKGDAPPSEAGARIAMGRVLEAAIPLPALNLAAGDRVEFSVTLLDRAGDPIARFPSEGALSVRIDPFAERWRDWSA